ncbi:uncharacterized protein GGS22DRAFT_189610 [Annulohypoxylon maeteangense]|uniref:uncharacterized protein n=1 Tax=Annulohypoxylon maeteangense TaxID=1927788 RepID=UPI0020083D8F|nr:uncharacterized protein GGS22DRAFT_189610 [Annulohypoxylon maeteangense]KAI0884482.1 hypothetical protein GGS22DRAFT_189610 [Annulohypoxylon maeteangense]
MNRKHPQHESQTASQISRSSAKVDIAMICDIKLTSKPIPLKREAARRNRVNEHGENDLEKGKGTLSGLTLTPHDVEVSIRWNMVFTWQAPIMLLAYSVMAFLVGMTVYNVLELKRL